MERPRVDRPRGVRVLADLPRRGGRRTKNHRLSCTRLAGSPGRRLPRALPRLGAHVARRAGMGRHCPGSRRRCGGDRPEVPAQTAPPGSLRHDSPGKVFGRICPDGFSTARSRHEHGAVPSQVAGYGRVMGASSASSSRVVGERRLQELDEKHFAEIDVAMLYIEEARERAARCGGTSCRGRGRAPDRGARAERGGALRRRPAASPGHPLRRPEGAAEPLARRGAVGRRDPPPAP